MSDIKNTNSTTIDLVKLIHGPLMTEKSFSETESRGEYVFKVAPNANKSQIKQAIEQYFNVKVKAVNTLNHKGKVKSFKQKKGRRNNVKKAYVYLQPGQEIDFISSAE